jgi:hypothetical protein
MPAAFTGTNSRHQPISNCTSTRTCSQKMSRTLLTEKSRWGFQQRLEGHIFDTLTFYTYRRICRRHRHEDRRQI